MHGNRVSVTDPAGNTTYYNHDELGRVVSETGRR
ncbi:MAG: RHS repeat protein [Desulfofustis sp. PB-SRB1]|nr:RHS repeat protein [Desulfofustis sp. PB-SRB1]